MPEHRLSDVPAGNPVSPKVAWPVIIQVLALAVTTASTLEWSETQWIQSALLVLTAVAGYFVNDPARVTGE